MDFLWISHGFPPQPEEILKAPPANMDMFDISRAEPWWMLGETSCKIPFLGGFDGVFMVI